MKNLCNSSSDGSLACFHFGTEEGGIKRTISQRAIIKADKRECGLKDFYILKAFTLPILRAINNISFLGFISF